MSELLRSTGELRAWRARVKQAGSRTVGLVPTMGALHAGHAELLRRSRAENELSILSIFVNPTQFNDPKDLDKYPRTLEADLELAREQGVDAVFFPNYAELYPDGYRYKITENELSLSLCGAHRPGHFDGVLTVVMKLLNLVAPDRAYFGEKDFQQLELVRGMVRAFFLPFEIVAVPTVREADGLAMSSRNTRLSPADRERAAALPRTLLTSTSAASAAEELGARGFEVDYVEDSAGRRLAAAKIGGVRLIDNIMIERGTP